MSEKYYTLIMAPRSKRWGKPVSDYFKFAKGERSPFVKKLKALEAEFVEKHPLHVRAYGGVFGYGAARKYPKPVLGAENMPTGVTLHPKNTPRDRNGAPKLPGFSLGEVGGLGINLVSDHVKRTIDDLEPGNFLFFPFELDDPVSGVKIPYWIMYALRDDDAIDYVASGYVQSEGGNWYAPRVIPTFDLKLDADFVRGRHLITSPAVNNYVFSKTLVDKLGKFLRRGQELEELEVISRGAE